MIKRILFLFIFCVSFSYSDEIDVFKKILSDSTGYYYNEEECRVIFFKLNGKAINKSEQRIDFINNKASSGFILTHVFFDSNYALEKQNYTIKNEKLLSFDYLDRKYIPLGTKDEKEMISKMRTNCLNRFERICGSYTDTDSQRCFDIKRNGNKFILKVTYPASEKIENVTEELSLYDNTHLQGEKYSIEFYDKRMVVFDPNIPEKYIKEYEELPSIGFIFPVEALSVAADENPVVIKNVEFYKDAYYYYDGTSKKLSINKDIITLLKTDGTSDYKSYNSYRGYKMYQDDMGWKHLEVQDEYSSLKLLVIDGTDMSCAFAYTGDKLSDDENAVRAQFKEVTKFTPYNRKINGFRLNNARASSTLTDKYHEYNAEGILKVFSPLTNNPHWWKNNIPWVEGKSDDGIGEFIEFDILLDDLTGLSGINLRILGGYVDPLKPHLFKQNNRIKKLLVETTEGFSKELSFKDAVEFTKIELPKDTKHVKLTIKEVYKGSKYSDTCITAIQMDWDNGGR